MKRDFDLVRQLLKMLERRDDRIVPTSSDLLVAGFSKKDVDLHIELMKEARMVDALIKLPSVTQNDPGSVIENDPPRPCPVCPDEPYSCQASFAGRLFFRLNDSMR